MVEMAPWKATRPSFSLPGRERRDKRAEVSGSADPLPEVTAYLAKYMRIILFILLCIASFRCPVVSSGRNDPSVL